MSSLPIWAYPVITTTCTFKSMLKRQFGSYLLLSLLLVLTVMFGFVFYALVDEILFSLSRPSIHVFVLALGISMLWLATLLVLMIPSLTVGKGNLYIVFPLFFSPIIPLASFFYNHCGCSREALANFMFSGAALAVIYSLVLTLADDYEGALSFLKCFKPYRVVQEDNRVYPAEAKFSNMYPAEAYHCHQPPVCVPSEPPLYYVMNPQIPQVPIQPSNPVIIY